MTVPVPRVGGRLFVLDAEDRVLLIHERLEDGTTHWLTPGGGVEPGENPRTAAMREAAEETGLRIVVAPDAPQVHRTRRLWSWAGIQYDQLDHFYLARVPTGVPVAPRALTQVERTTLLGFAWWTVPELRLSTAVFVPPDIADVLDRVLTLERSRG